MCVKLKAEREQLYFHFQHPWKNIARKGITNEDLVPLEQYLKVCSPYIYMHQLLMYF